MATRILVVDDSPTIRKVVGGILERHEFVPILAEDGLDALQKLGGRPADLGLVDFVMPKMNGYQFCQSVRQSETLRNMPIVLMSAKGDRIRGKFVQQTGALDAITKPFDARALIAVIQSALEKRRPADQEIISLDAELDAELLEDSEPPPATDSGLRVAEHLAKLFLPELRKLSRQGGTGWAQLGQPELAQCFAQALTVDAGLELGALLQDTDFGGEKTELLSGDLGSVSIAEILQLLDVQRKTGSLTISHRKSRVTLFMRDGSLDFATYAGLPEEFLLGRYLVQAGTLTRAALDEHIEQSRHTGQLLGDYLVSSAVLTEDQLKTALTHQTSELVYEIVRWRSGRFRFVAQSDALAARTQLGISTAGLVMEGFRRVDEWRLIEGSFDFGDVLFKDELAIAKLGSSELTVIERRVIDAVDGDQTIGDIVDGLEFGSFETCKVLYRLLNSRLVKRQ